MVGGEAGSQLCQNKYTWPTWLPIEQTIIKHISCKKAVFVHRISAGATFQLGKSLTCTQHFRSVPMAIIYCCCINVAQKCLRTMSVCVRKDNASRNCAEYTDVCLFSRYYYFFLNKVL